MKHGETRRFQVDLRRLDAGSIIKAAAQYRSLQKDLIGELALPDNIATLPSSQPRAMLNAISEILVAHYAAAEALVNTDNDGLARTLDDGTESSSKIALIAPLVNGDTGIECTTGSVGIKIIF